MKEITTTNHGVIHVHTNNSGDSVVKESDLVKYAKDKDFEFITMTNHGNLFGTEDFLNACKDADIKGIIGVEGYVSFPIEEINIEKAHIILLAKNLAGYRAISNAVTKANIEMESDTPIMSLDILKDCCSNGDVIATTACMDGIINKIFNYNTKYNKKISKIEGKKEGYTDPNSVEYSTALNTVSEKELELARVKNKITECKQNAKQYKTEIANLEKKIKVLEKDDSFASVTAIAAINTDIDYIRKKQIANDETLVTSQNEEAKAKVLLQEAKKLLKSLEGSVSKYLEKNSEIESLKNEMISEERLEEIAEDALIMFRDIFGEENFFVEIQNHRIPAEMYAMKKIASIARKLQIPIVAANDAHMLSNTDDEIRARKLKMGVVYKKFSPISVGDDELYLKDDESLISILKEIFDENIVEEAMDNIAVIGDMCEMVEIPEESHYPKWNGEKDANSTLRELAYNNIPWRFPNNDFTDEYKKRLEYELGVICKMGYADYHLIVADFLEFGRRVGYLSDIAKTHLTDIMSGLTLDEMVSFVEKNRADIGLSIGPGRGSAVGSLVCYLLGITALDPIKYGLLFERFLNIERVSMPDIDSDFSPEIREIVLEYVKKKYGYDSVCSISTDSTLAAKNAIRGAARVYGMELYPDDKDGNTKFYDLGDEICKAVPDRITSFSQKLESGEVLYNYLYEKFKGNKNALQILKDASLIEGTTVARGTHAAGVIIADNNPVSDYVPLMKNKDGLMACQCDMILAEQKGLLKMDFLGLNNLKIITDCMRLAENKGFNKDVSNLPFEKEVFDNIYSKGDTNGIFQFESPGMKSMLKKFKPSSFEDLIILVSMYRPGPLQYLDEVIATKNGAKGITFLTPELEPILGKTYGAIVYQEQVMQIFQDLAGYTLGAADQVRRYMSKKKADKLAKEREAFVNGDKDRNIKGCNANGISSNIANTLFDQMMDFAAYAFNKSHAAAYAYVSYITAYLKYHYPVEFIVAIANNVPLEDIVPLLEECKRKKIKVLPPDINKSDSIFIVEDGQVRFGLSKIKGVASSADKLIASRNNFDFQNLFEVISTGIDVGSLGALIKAGCFDQMYPDYNRQSLLSSVSDYMAVYKDIADYERKVNEGNEILELLDKNQPITETYKYYKKFDRNKVESNRDAARVQLKNLKRMTGFSPEHMEEDITKRRLDEQEVLGMLLSENILDKYEIPKDAKEIGSITDGKFQTLCGVISKCKIITVKKGQYAGQEMCFITLEDNTGSIDCTIFTKDYNKIDFELQIGLVVTVKGNISLGYDSYAEDEKLKCVLYDVSLTKEKEKIIYITFACHQRYFEMAEAIKEYKSENGEKLVIISNDYPNSEANFRVSKNILKDARFKSFIR